jgi:hypothetical protein
MRSGLQSDTVIRGQPLRTLWCGIVLLIADVIFAGWIWSSDEPTPKRLHAIFLIFGVSALLTVGLAVAVGMTMARINDQAIQFVFAGITTRTILLSSITHYDPTLGGTIAIVGKAFFYCPSGLLDHSKIASELERRGIGQKADA